MRSLYSEWDVSRAGVAFPVEGVAEQAVFAGLLWSGDLNLGFAGRVDTAGNGIDGDLAALAIALDGFCHDFPTISEHITVGVEGFKVRLKSGAWFDCAEVGRAFQFLHDGRSVGGHSTGPDLFQ